MLATCSAPGPVLAFHRGAPLWALQPCRLQAQGPLAQCQGVQLRGRKAAERSGHLLGVLGRVVVQQGDRPGRGRHARGVKVVLDNEGHAEERRQRLVCAARLRMNHKLVTAVKFVLDDDGHAEERRQRLICGARLRVDHKPLTAAPALSHAAASQADVLSQKCFSKARRDDAGMRRKGRAPSLQSKGQGVLTMLSMLA